MGDTHNHATIWAATPFKHLRHFPAKGVITRDDTAVLQRAIDAGGGVVFVPPGRYRLSSPLILRTGVTLVGCGRLSILECTTDTAAIVIGDVADVRIERLVLRNSGTPTSASASGIRDTSSLFSQRVIITDVEVDGFYHGVRTTNLSEDWTLTRVWAHDSVHSGFMGGGPRQAFLECRATANGTNELHHGLYLNALADEVLAGIRVVGGHYSENAGAGIHIYTESDGAVMRDISVQGAQCSDNGQAEAESAQWGVVVATGITATGAISGVTLGGVVVTATQGTNGSGFWVGPRATRVSLNGCVARDCSRKLLEVTGTGQASITGGSFHNVHANNNAVLLAGDGSLLVGASITGTGTHAVHITGSENAVVGNRMSGQTGDGVRMEGDDNTVVGNVTSGNPLRNLNASARRNLYVANHTVGDGLVNTGSLLRDIGNDFATSQGGAFTLDADGATTVANVNVRSSSRVLLMPTNAAAASLMAGASALYVSALVEGESFTVSTADAGNAAGTETFNYVIVN